MIRLLAVLLLGFLTALSAQADEILWARRTLLGKTLSVTFSADGRLTCNECNPLRDGAQPIQLGPGIDRASIQAMSPTIATLWVVILREDQGNSCGGAYYSLSVRNAILRRIDTSRFNCRSVNLAAEERGLGMRLTMVEDRGRQRVTLDIE